MTEIHLLFEARKQEIELYFEHLTDFLERKATIHLPNGTEKELEMPLQHILLSNSFLLLYNLIEFTISNAIEAIYQEILDEGVSYNQIQPNIQIEIWDHVRKNVNTKRFIESLDDLVMDIVKHHPKSSDLFTGNVDQEAIKRLGQQYGFSVHTDARKTKNGEKLKIIKNRRNELAHGFKSFQECGQERTFQEIKLIKTESLLYLEQILKNIADFLTAKRYLK
jgi:hypothetical protein